MGNEWNSGNNTHRVGQNMFMTWTDAEYKKILGAKNAKIDKEQAVLDTSNLKDGVNWVTQDKVSPVKNQGQCGSCWSFSTTGSMESANVIQNGGEMIEIAEQQFVDCDTAHDMGCNGGNPVWAYQYASQTPIMRESSYPYIAKKSSDTSKCYDASSEGVLSVTDFDYIQSKPASDMKAAIAKQPVAILVEADQRVFQLYRDGVLTSAACGTTIDHAVLAAGYGTDEETEEEYFLVKNSWGPTWGGHGYIKIGTNNVCGILTLGAWP